MVVIPVAERAKPRKISVGSSARADAHDVETKAVIV
jgi:hypothetical protein